ncbi:NAD(P)H-dependent oxidoreductase [Francisella tularensis]|uniref:NADPH-dependent FMN reductase n=1 Tax=Francisella tularensis TaxID=263 RepID=UPI000A15FC29|nr:NAD(P)H-dependent oxidoreductase [Francisella tularensis]MBK2150837.1 NAD(P)H-dependent oxidoreductase [Francisella tularensis]MBK2251956.1 NAD(P)H-dependent oxidoreductase [Francisella tularensis]NDS81586.1 NAD(P)H-dependent oxidoreductase [Francisella tularensis subsp. holarctica]NDT61540.1 NAD(P)H-dependent oxidoreductase [Francisella tularensis subsp. holarctica]ORX28628.1 NADPH-dependent FMN reductase [Francisella tularensis subsp. holarctica]
MKKILVFSTSNSKNSINQKFVKYVANLIPNIKTTLLDINDFEMPIYSIDRENTYGIHPLAYDFKKNVKGHDALIISLAEHNGAYTAAFKNIFDWISRINDGSIWYDKPILLLSTSPGPRGAKTVLNTAKVTFGLMSKGEVTPFSLPEFNKNFDTNTGITDTLLKNELDKCITNFTNSI